MKPCKSATLPFKGAAAVKSQAVAFLGMVLLRPGSEVCPHFLGPLMKDREAWRAAVHRVTKGQTHLATEQ